MIAGLRWAYRALRSSHASSVDSLWGFRWRAIRPTSNRTFPLPLLSSSASGADRRLRHFGHGCGLALQYKEGGRAARDARPTGRDSESAMVSLWAASAAPDGGRPALRPPGLAPACAARPLIVGGWFAPRCRCVPWPRRTRPASVWFPFRWVRP